MQTASTAQQFYIYRNAHDIRDGRRSFPSGHSSAAFASMTFISLLIAGKTAAWCFAVIPYESPRALRASKLARLSLTIFPLLFATWVAVSRIEDYVCQWLSYLSCDLTDIYNSGTTKRM